MSAQNKHAAEAQDIMTGNAGSSLGYETGDAQHIVAHIEANTQATLALAYEQRTANLIAAYQAEVTGTGRVKGIGAAIDRHNEILDRLGL